MSLLPHDRIAKDIPLFNKRGEFHTTAELEKIADEKGICVSCGVKVAQFSFFRRKKKLLTNDDVCNGVCRKCNPDWVPAFLDAEVTVQQASTTQNGHGDSNSDIKFRDDGPLNPVIAEMTGHKFEKCSTCGKRLADIYNGTRTLLTNDDAYKGICRQCNYFGVLAAVRADAGATTKQAPTANNSINVSGHDSDSDIKSCDDSAVDPITDELQKIAAKADPSSNGGACTFCGVELKEIDPIDGTQQLLTNDDVYNGICRKCNPTWIPATDLSNAEATIQHTLTTQPGVNHVDGGHENESIAPGYDETWPRNQKINQSRRENSLLSKDNEEGQESKSSRSPEPVLQLKRDDHHEAEQDGSMMTHTLESTSVSTKPVSAPEDTHNMIFQQTHHVTDQDHSLGRLLETTVYNPETMATALQTIAGCEVEIQSIIASKQEADADQLELQRILTNPVARDFYLSFCSMLSSKVITCQALYTDNIKHKVGPLSRENICDAVSNCAAKRAIKSMATLSEKFPEDYTVLESIKLSLQSIAEASGNSAFNMEMLGETIKDASLAIQLPGTYAAAAVLFKLVGLPSEIKRRKQIAYVVLFAAIAEKDDGLENVLKQVARRVLRLVEIADVLPHTPIKGMKKLQRRLSGSIVDTAAKEFGQKLAEQIFKYIAKPKKTEQLWDILDNCNTATKLWDALVCEAFQVSPDILNRRYGNASVDEPSPKTNPPNDSAAAATNQSSGTAAAFVDTDGQMNANSGATVADADGRMQRIERAVENLTAAVERTTGHEVDLGRQVLLRRCPEEEYQYRLERLEALVGGLCEQVQAMTTAQEVSREDVESELRRVQEEVQSLRR